MDNMSKIKLAKKPVQHERSKHIDTRFHFIRDHVKHGTIKVEYYHTLEQVANIFTTPLAFKDFMKIRDMLSMKQIQKGGSDCSSKPSLEESVADIKPGQQETESSRVTN